MPVLASSSSITAREAAATMALSEDCRQPRVNGKQLRSGLPSKRTLALRDENGCAGSDLARRADIRWQNSL